MNVLDVTLTEPVTVRVTSAEAVDGHTVLTVALANAEGDTVTKFVVRTRDADTVRRIASGVQFPRAERPLCEVPT